MKFDKGLISVSTTLLILSSLKKGDMYGYQLMSDLQTRSDGIFDFKEGTLYPVLYALERDNYIKSYSQKAENNRNRKYYSITENGKNMLDKKTQEWDIFVVALNKMIKREPSI